MHVKETLPNKCRKKKYAPETYTAKTDPKYPDCNHNSKRFKCSALTVEEVHQFHQLFYKVPDKLVQDNFILKYVSACPIQRVRNPDSTRPRTLSAAYYVKTSNKVVVPVCRSAFLKILNITKHRVEGVLRRFFEKGDMSAENRGGDHRSHLKQAIRDNIKKFIKKFPILEKHYCRGHSFLPPDRVFALIEKKIRKLDTIIHPEVYYDIFENYGTLKKLGVDWHVQDWKQAAKANLKSPAALHFKINSCKRFVFTISKEENVLVKGEPHYNSDVNQSRGICKRGKKISQIRPQNVELNSVIVNPKKLKNIDELLTKHFGAEWKEESEELYLEYYKGLLETLQEGDRVENDKQEEVLEDQCSYHSDAEGV
ncbi:hypothetical protein RI129_002714 [Pyrocoelia pectoralis]|uniref:Uncharacterized protein n=1 Tax=Pyrocoelia pectoralis TaxID=417401 RepID=A0AAN7ZLT5_9COLE